ncbi:hypothetical protein A9X00_07075 [Mycobacterium sp. 1245805.9]|nr:hypothetical protein A9X00_07075 [Mycobacterium sp. 1245805.9]
MGLVFAPPQRCHDLAVDLRPPPGADYLRDFTAATLGGWSWSTPADADAVTIDLWKVKFIDAMGLATIAAVAEDAVACGRSVRFVAPRREDVCRYMSRMHLGECLAEFCPDVRLPRVNEWDRGHRLLELHRFDASSGDDLAERLFQALRAAGSSEQDAASIFKGVSEVVSNVAEHSGAAGGWAAMQVMPNNDGLITFAVADAGDGFEYTLSRNHWVSGSVDAMMMAFERTVSGTGVPGRGTGLDDLHKRVGRHQGRLLAWSGDATGRSSGGTLECREANAAFPGTVIYAGLKPQPREVGT